MEQAIQYVNQLILSEAKGLKYLVKADAPNTEADLFNAPSLIIWSGASDHTVFSDASVNWAFRALHDALHLKTGLNFSPEAEIELGRIQASKYTSSLMQELIYAEVSMQAAYYAKTGHFVQDQATFTINHLTRRGVL
jgi:hypothetical protein